MDPFTACAGSLSPPRSSIQPQTATPKDSHTTLNTPTALALYLSSPLSLHSLPCASVGRIFEAIVLVTNKREWLDARATRTSSCIAVCSHRISRFIDRCGARGRQQSRDWSRSSEGEATWRLSVVVSRKTLGEEEVVI